MQTPGSLVSQPPPSRRCSVHETKPALHHQRTICARHIGAGSQTPLLLFPKRFVRAHLRTLGLGCFRTCSCDRHGGGTVPTTSIRREPSAFPASSPCRATPSRGICMPAIASSGLHARARSAPIANARRFKRQRVNRQVHCPTPRTFVSAQHAPRPSMTERRCARVGPVEGRRPGAAARATRARNGSAALLGSLSRSLQRPGWSLPPTPGPFFRHPVGSKFKFTFGQLLVASRGRRGGDTGCGV
ncbi:hypothetical protein B0H15DRAFT_487824 [Mycena belliarum]|uniref:Uncharacterized protein n=1 Tax=Mycena belliarum TaxID=1033014 RepID=A0AAD6TWM7_9AGAR|nr:hypothetical protein B0H15DRAFT_487824 [Mycena belliae]